MYYGPGGVGKTALLREFLYLCREQGTPAHYLDTRGIEPTPSAVTNELKRTAGEHFSLTAPVPGDGERRVLMIDTYEELAPLDHWVRDEFVPSLPPAVLLVLASRQRYGPEWRSGTGLRQLMRPMPLRNLERSDSRHYLRQRGMPADRHEKVLSEFLFLLRGNPIVRPLFQQLKVRWNERETDYFVKDDLKPSDWPALRAMTARHEGEASAAMLDYWRERLSEEVSVFGDAEGHPQGFLWCLDISTATREDRRRDPALAAAYSYLEQKAPLREGETGLIFHFWMARTAYQNVSPVQRLIFVQTVRWYLDAGGTPLEPIYAGEDNVTQGGIDLSSALSSYSMEEITAAFDEPLSMDEVLNIAGQFIVS